MTALNIEALAQEYQTKSPQEILELALSSFDNIAVSFSGAEDVVLVDMGCKLAKKLGKKLHVFSLDTGRLHAQTYQFIDQVRSHYQTPIDIMFPDSQAVEKLVNEKGLYSFYKDDHKECCGIRKVQPLRRKLATLDAWITGQRKDQSVGTRTQLAVIEKDGAFSTAEKTLIKFNPLANWTSAQTWEYIRMFDVPYNALHAQGFTSIGCEPCTKSVLPNQHEREGRWWWEEATHKECGLHAANIKK